MADIELVIKIPEGLAETICEQTYDEHEVWDTMDAVRDAIRKDNILPKGHGALKDADEVFAVMERNLDMQDLYLPIHFKQFALDEAKTIVPADKEG